MQHNLQFGADADANHTLAVARAQTLKEDLVAERDYAPGLRLSVDPAADLRGSWSSVPGQIAALEIDLRRPGQWLALHLVLGGFPLAGHHLFGFVLRSRAQGVVTLRPCLRSARGTGFADCFFPKRVVAFEESSTHVDLLVFGRADPIPAEAAWRDLVLFFEPASAALTIEDWRVFIV